MHEHDKQLIEDLQVAMLDRLVDLRCLITNNRKGEKKQRKTHAQNNPQSSPILASRKSIQIKHENNAFFSLTSPHSAALP